MNPDAGGDTKSKRGCSLRAIGCSVVMVLILAIAVYPIIKRSDGSGDRKGTCLSNLKELVMALHLYTEDHGGALPCAAPGSSEQQISAFCTRRAGAGQSGGPKGFVSTLLPYLKSEEIAKCPSDRVPNKSATAVASYFYRPAVNRASMNGAKVTWFSWPGSQIVIFERLPFHDGEVHETWLGRRWVYDYRAVKGWEGGANLNVAYMDGHVAYQSCESRTASGVTLREMPHEAGPALTRIIARPGWPCWFGFDVKAKKVVKSNAWDPRRYRDEIQ